MLEGDEVPFTPNQIIDITYLMRITDEKNLYLFVSLRIHSKNFLSPSIIGKEIIHGHS